MRSGFIVASLLIVTNILFAQNRQPAFEMNERLGRGINMGNSFEAPTEAEWGNPWNPDYFRIISELGFSHVRLPVRWETAARTMETFPYTIAPAFLTRIKEVVDNALKNKLHIIINMHHHDALYEDPAGHKEKFLSQWNQIATYFKDYPDSLLFEVLNEPHGNLSPALWNEFFADALGEIRETNPTRVVLLGVANYGGLGSISDLVLPDDEYIILSAHYYNPFTFTHQGAEWVSGADAWLGTEWLDTEAERQSVESEFSYALHFSETHHIPLHVGEFGAYSKADMESRAKWTTFLARWFEEKNLSWAYWEFSAGFGIYNPATQQYVTPLVDALLHNEMPEPKPVFALPVYTSNFSGVDGWAINQQGGASGVVSASNNKLNVTILSPGTEAWHLQLVKNNVSLTQGKRYRLSITIAAGEDRSIAFYAGKASTPWNIYSNAGAMSISAAEATYSSTFEMTNPTDPAARLVIDLGLDLSGVVISGIALEELSFSEVVGVEQNESARAQFYPNPFSSVLYVSNPGRAFRAQLIDVHGRIISNFVIFDGQTTGFDADSLRAGVYIISFTADGRNHKLRVVKK